MINQSGFINILISIAVLAVVAIGGGIAYTSHKPTQPVKETQTKSEVAGEATPSASVSASASPKSTSKPSQTATVIKTPAPTPKTQLLRTIDVSGVTYEDRSDNGLFDSDDPKISNGMIYYYDTLNPSLKYTMHASTDGNFTITLTVNGKLAIQPAAWGGYTPKSSTQEYSRSEAGVKLGYRSASAPTGNNVGILEGNTFNDTNRNLVRDGGEGGIRFYKFYVQDSEGNYYEGDIPDDGGHFRFVNLPLGKTYTIRLSNPTGAFIMDQPETQIRLDNNKFQDTNIQIPVYKV